MSKAVAIMLLSCAVLVAPAWAGEADEATHESVLEDWDFQFSPYLWLPAVKGTAGVNGRTVAVDVGIDDELDLIGDHLSLIAGFGHFEARHGRFVGFLDAMGMHVDTDESARLKGIEDDRLSTGPIDAAISLELNSVVFEFGVGYQLLRMAMPRLEKPMTLEAIAGGRFNWFDASVDAKASTVIQGLPRGSQAVQRAASADGTLDWVDPFIGLRYRVPIASAIDFDFRGDIGGFGAGSELAWSLVSGFRYAMPWHPCGTDAWFLLGYKILAFDYETDSLELDLQYRGPITGLTVAF